MTAIGAANATSLAALVQQLSAIEQVIQQLTATMGGQALANGVIIPPSDAALGGGAVQPTMQMPTQSPMQMGAGAGASQAVEGAHAHKHKHGKKHKHGGGGGGAGHAHGGAPGKTGHSHGGKVGDGAGEQHNIAQRTLPENPAQAKQVLSFAMDLVKNVKYDELKPGKRGPTSTHKPIPDELRNKFKQAFPGMTAPSSVVFDKTTHKPIGLLFIAGKGAPNLPLGTTHNHGAGKNQMQHVWFTPNDINLAFSDITRNDEAKAAAAQQA